MCLRITILVFLFSLVPIPWVFSAETIVSGAIAYDLEVKNEVVYWSDIGETPLLKRTPDGIITPLARRMGVATGLAYKDGKIIWLESRSGSTPSCTGQGVIRILNQTDLTTFSTTQLWTGTDCAESTSDIIVTPKYIFWTSSVVSPNEFHILRLNRITGAIVTFYKTTLPIRSLLADSSNLYWLSQQFPNPGVIRRKPLSTGTSSLVIKASLPLADTMALSNDMIVYATLPYPMYSKANIFLVPKPGGIPNKLTETSILPRKFVANADDVYWIGDIRQDYWARTSLMKASRLNGGNTSLLVDELSSPSDLILTASGLFWLEKIQGIGMLRTYSLLNEEIKTVTGNLRQPDRLSTGGGYIFWSEGGRFEGLLNGVSGIFRVPSAGGITKTVASGIMSDPLHQSSDSLNISVAGGYVYIADKMTIKRTPVNPGRTEIVAVGNELGDLISDGSHVYGTDKISGSVYRVPVTGGQIQTLASLLSGPGGRIRLADRFVYWMDNDDTIRRVPKDGGPIATVALDLPFLSDFVAGTGSVFYATWDSGTINKISVTGGSPISLNAYCWPVPCSLAQSASDIYWVNQNTVGRVPKSIGNFTYLATTGGSPYLANSIVYTSNYVYWSDVENGTINRLPATE